MPATRPDRSGVLPASTVRTGLALLLLLAPATACSDGPTGAAPQEPPRVSFTYQGAASGSFTAVGVYRSNTDPLGQTYAYGQRFGSPAAVEVTGNLLRSGNLVDGIRIRATRTTPGTIPIDSDACPWWRDECPGVMVFLALPNRDGAQARFSCELETGTITVTAISSTRASGEFSGTGECLDRDDLENGFSAIVVTDGRFDVPLHAASRG